MSDRHSPGSEDEEEDIALAERKAKQAARKSTQGLYFMEEFWENFESKIAWGGSEDEEEDEASVDNEDGGSDGEDEASV